MADAGAARAQIIARGTLVGAWARAPAWDPHGQLAPLLGPGRRARGAAARRHQILGRPRAQLPIFFPIGARLREHNKKMEAARGKRFFPVGNWCYFPVMFEGIVRIYS